MNASVQQLVWWLLLAVPLAVVLLPLASALATLILLGMAMPSRRDYVESVLDRCCELVRVWRGHQLAPPNDTSEDL